MPKINFKTEKLFPLLKSPPQARIFIVFGSKNEGCYFLTGGAGAIQHGNLRCGVDRRACRQGRLSGQARLACAQRIRRVARIWA